MIHHCQCPQRDRRPPDGDQTTIPLGTIPGRRQDEHPLGSAWETAERLAKRIAALLDPEMRVAYLRHELRYLDVCAVADLLAIATARTEGRDTEYSVLLLSLSSALSAPEYAPTRKAVAALLESREQPDLAQMLHHEATEPDPGVTQPAPDLERRVPDFGFGRPLTLGERKALARRNDRTLIARVLTDPHPSVIRILLGNPALTEPDVVRLCARRPVPPEIQRAVLNSRRWIVRHRVKMAIALNPHTPLDVALQILPHLTASDLRRVAAAEDLSAQLREACRRRAKSTSAH